MTRPRRSIRSDSTAGRRRLALLCAAAALAAALAPRRAAASAVAADRPLLIVGSLNADTTISLERLPARGECITSTKPVPSLAVGGKVRTCKCKWRMLWICSC